MLTKVEPFFDNFDDNNYTGWTIAGGSWTAANGFLEPTSTTTFSRIRRTTSDADNECTFRYRINDTSASNARMYITPRSVDTNNRGFVMIYPGSMKILKVIAGTQTTLQTNTSATSAQDVWYNVRIKTEGSTITVWRWEDGQMPTQVLQRTDFGPASTYYYQFDVATNYPFDLDDIRILADGLSNTTTFTVNNANELATMTDYNGTTNFAFDDWGRMTSKARGSYSATYGYRYDGLLHAGTSSFPAEGNITFDYTAEGLQWERTEGSSTTRYRRAGHKIVAQDEDAGNLAVSLVASPFAYAMGADTSVATWRYASLDNLNSVRSVREENSSSVAEIDHAPFGTDYQRAGVESLFGYAQLVWSRPASLYSATYRCLAPGAGRWLTRDPARKLAGTNTYLYVSASPVSLYDPLGLWGSAPGMPPEFYDGYLNPPRPGYSGSCLANADRYNSDIMNIRWDPEKELPHYEFMQHCLHSCLLSRSNGQFCALIAGWVNELPIVGTGTSEWHDLDYFREGRKCGAQTALNCRACCRYQAHQRHAK